MELAMRKVVEHVFNNWTALQLAVEHSMAGPNSREAAVSMLDYMVPFCINEAKHVTDIVEALEDLMDEEFDTICEDGSVEEIASVLFKFIEILKSGNSEHYDEEFNKLPVAKDWLIKSRPQEVKSVPREQKDSSGASTSTNTIVEPMEQEAEESEWTQVKSRRRQ